MDKGLQLSELEMLDSMFPDNIKFDEYNSLDMVDSSASEDDRPISYSLPILFESDTKKEIHLSVTYPQNYPSEKMMEVHVQSDSFDRGSQSRVNLDLIQYLRDVWQEGDLLMGIVVSWVQDQGSEYFHRQPEQQGDSPEANKSPQKLLPLKRLWIYSHHLYSKIKRKDILDLSKDFSITGFSLPGKPGIICLEGMRTEEVWSRIKSWNWKKIGVRIIETSKPNEGEEEFCRFKDFKEMNFLKSDQTRDYHMDFGEFRKFLSEHDSEYIFKEIVGLK
uniref:RWD domain-containing protein 2A n=1 Tax=Caligus rogercresseyi TaxID=217165 RepID=C1BRB2_CALRO|nr:RWD domain-containing protein 2A [Caligus rogercresseyi]